MSEEFVQLSLKELKENLIEYSHKISEDEEKFFNLPEAEKTKPYVFCNGVTFPLNTSSQYIRGYIEGVRCTLGSCLVHIELVEEKMDSVSGFSRWYPRMKQVVNKEQHQTKRSDYDSGELVGQNEALEYIRRRYKFGS